MSLAALFCFGMLLLRDEDETLPEQTLPFPLIHPTCRYVRERLSSRKKDPKSQSCLANYTFIYATEFSVCCVLGMKIISISYGTDIQSKYLLPAKLLK